MPGERHQPRQSGRRLGDGDGSVLLLVPACIVVMVVLASIVLDSAVAFLAEREAEAAATAAAADLAALAVDADVLRSTGDVQLHLDAVGELSSVLRSTVTDRLSAAFVPGSVDVEVAVVDADRVTVTVRGEAVRLIGPSSGATLRSRPIEATVVARAEPGE